MWQPSASRLALVERQRLNRVIRDYFEQQQVLEVETPILGQAPVSDPNIEPMQTLDQRYLHTSPEYAMKRLLCDGMGDIFQICKVFRRGEAGRRHNPEFSMLEWYRLDWSLDQLMQEVATLTSAMLGLEQPLVEYYHYRTLVLSITGLDPFMASDDEIIALGSQLAGGDLGLSRDGWLDVIMSHAVEPALPADQLIFVSQFPASQAALARVVTDDEGFDVAERFELFYRGTELANGYHELADFHEQRRRFEAEANGRPIDEALLQALEAGLPDCSGVAMGLDRILMHRIKANAIADVISFDWTRA